MIRAVIDKDQSAQDSDEKRKAACVNPRKNHDEKANMVCAVERYISLSKSPPSLFMDVT